MPSRYHPIEDGLWDDPKFDETKEIPEARGDERGFFAFLASNKMQRPAGIYRASDGELAGAYRMPVRWVIQTMTRLVNRGLIVRDGAWVFLPGYLKRQAQNPKVLSSARKTVKSCSSPLILSSFIQHYPLHREWLPNGFETVGIGKSISDPPVPEQSSTRAVPEQSREDLCGERPPVAASPPNQPIAGPEALDPDLAEILKDCPHLALISNGDSALFWDQVLKSCAPYGVDDTGWIGARIRKWNHWFQTHKARRSHSRESLESRLMKWLAKDLDELALRKAP